MTKWTPSHMRLSPSKINTYNKCPREFYYNYIAKLPQKKTIHLFRGTLVHQILEDLFKKQFKTLPQWEKGVPKLWVQGQFEDGWEAKIAKHKWLWEVHTKEEMDAMYKETEALLQNFVDSVNKKLTEMVEWKIFKNKQQAWNAVAPKYAEKWVKSKDYAIVGVIDVVCNDFDGGTTLLDYKTSKRYGPYLPEEYYRQLIIYAFLYTLEMGEMPNFVGVNYLRFDDTFFVKITQSELDEARDLIKYVHDCIKEREEYEEKYEQKPQNLCKWCSFHKSQGGPCDAEIPKWEPKGRKRKKETYSDIDQSLKKDLDVESQSQFPDYD
jgi:putative RecB family exonuclease|tara:strand:- start:144 stop:1112 length:969 start_codon:yes stop_codon:yes gene_type:complete